MKINFPYYQFLKNRITHLYEEKPYLMVLLVISFYLLFLWYPLNSIILHTQESIFKNQTLLKWIINTEAQITRLNTMPIKMHNDSLLTIVDREMKMQHWDKLVTDLRQSENNQVELSINNINFDDLILWIEQLWQKNTIQVVEISVEQIESSHLIKATLTLQ